jgi:quercetin dioxygenase-like cupin family protein
MHRAAAGFSALAVTAALAMPAAQAPAIPAPGAGPAPAAAAPAPPPPPVAPAPGEEPATIVKVHQEPHHRQVFQHGPMRILDLQLPPGDMSWFHTHDWPVFYLTLTSSRTRTQNLGMEFGARLGGPGRGAAAPGGRAAGAPRGGGAAGPGAAPAPPRGGGPGRGGAPPGGGGPPLGVSSTTTYIEQPVTHRLQNIGTGLFRAMVVVNETNGDDTVTPQGAGFSGTPAFTNNWYRAYRIGLAPGERTAAHQHRAPVVILQANAGKGAGAGAITWEFNEPGQWAFFDAGDPHAFLNSGSDRLELIEVELRRK